MAPNPPQGPSDSTDSGPNSKNAVPRNAPPAEVPPKQSQEVFAFELLIGNAIKPPANPARKSTAKRVKEITLLGWRKKSHMARYPKPRKKKWQWRDLNPRPKAYESLALPG